MLAVLFKYRAKMLLSIFKGGAGIGKSILFAFAFLLALFGIISISIAIYAAANANPDLGAKLLETLVSMVFHGMFVLLLFTGLSLAVFTVYFGTDLSLLFSLPIDRKTLFTYKFLEALILNARLSIIFLTPCVILLGMFYNASPIYYINAVIITIFMAAIPGALGIIFSSLFINKVSRAKMKNAVAIGGSILGVLIWVAISTFMRTIDSDTGPINTGEFQIPAILTSPVFKFLPSGWASRAAISSAHGNWLDALYPMIFLTAVGLVLSYAAMRITARYYEKGLAEDTGAASAAYSPQANLGGSPLMAHIKRDLILLYRQPQVMVQIMLMLFFMILYPFIKGPNELGIRQGLPLSIPMIIFAVMFGAQLGSRLIPLERHAFYRNFMIPGGARFVLLEKFLLGLGIAILCSFAIGATHVLVGKAESFNYLIFLAAFSVIGFSLGLPIGLFYADFGWEHPRRMLKGGGTFILIQVTLIFGGLISVAMIFMGKFISPVVTTAIITVISLVLASTISMMKLSNYEWLS